MNTYNLVTITARGADTPDSSFDVKTTIRIEPTDSRAIAAANRAVVQARKHLSGLFDSIVVTYGLDPATVDIPTVDSAVLPRGRRPIVARSDESPL